MRFLDLLHKMEGYLTIRAEGVFLERFLNLCTRRELDIWNVRRMGAETLVAEISLASFRKLRSACYRTKTRVQIVKRKGLPFFLHRYRKRKFALIGLILAVLFLWYTSNHIMGITVFGNQRIPTETVLMHLARSGVALGKSAHNLDSSDIRNQMMRDMDDLAWVGINMSGSRIYVEVVERLEKEPGVEVEKPCHLVAKKDGQILSVEARNGQTMVKKGAGVRAGDLLISGIMDNDAVGYRYVHAYGEVFAQTKYTMTREYPLRYQEMVMTGKEKRRIVLKILDKKIPLYWGKEEPYENAKIEEKVKEYRLPMEMLPSLFVEQKHHQEQVPEEKSRTAAEALTLGKKELYLELQASLPAEAEVISREYSDTVTERGTVEVTVTFVCKENIAVEEPIESIEEISE